MASPYCPVLVSQPMSKHFFISCLEIPGPAQVQGNSEQNRLLQARRNSIRDCISLSWEANIYSATLEIPRVPNLQEPITCRYPEPDQNSQCLALRCVFCITTQVRWWYMVPYEHFFPNEFYHKNFIIYILTYMLRIIYSELNILWLYIVVVWAR
jgi:hypothetical protein